MSPSRLIPLVSALVCACLLALAPAVVAAQSPGPDIKPDEELIARMPAELLGVRAERIPADSPLITFFPQRMGTDPVVGMTVTRSSGTDSFEALRERARGAFHETGLRQVYREGTFRSANWPDANTFFGEYLAGSGLKQTWILQTGTGQISVTATMFRTADRERVAREVGDKVFGGVALTAAAPGRES